ncbi:hypothetical protein GS474_10480 [Rhodococcus hoagii]|nr:hypothetical protein [Prescottella equi]
MPADVGAVTSARTGSAPDDEQRQDRLPVADELARELADTSSGRPLSGTESVVAAVVSDVLGHRVDVDAGSSQSAGIRSLPSRSPDAWRSRSAGTSRRACVLEAPTLAALARTIDTGAASARSELVRTDTEPVPIAPAQRRLWLLHRAEPTVPTTSCRSSSGSANPSTRARSPRPSATWWIGTKRCGRTTRTRRVRRSRAAGDVEVAIVHEPLSRNELDRWIGRMASRPFDLTSRPPLRAALLRAESASGFSSS